MLIVIEVDFGDNRSAIGVAERRMGVQLRKTLYSNLYMTKIRSGMTSRISWWRGICAGFGCTLQMCQCCASVVPVCITVDESNLKSDVVGYNLNSTQKGTEDADMDSVGVPVGIGLPEI